MWLDVGDTGGRIRIKNFTDDEAVMLEVDEYGNGLVGVHNRKGKGRTLEPRPLKIGRCGRSIECVLCPPGEHRRVRTTAPRRLDAAGAVCIMSGEPKTAIFK